MVDRALLERVTKELIDQGKLLEAGWIGLRLRVIPDDASATQLDEMRMAYFAGAQHLFSSIMSMLDPDAEPTENDLGRMDLISAELNNFLEAFKRRPKSTVVRSPPNYLGRIGFIWAWLSIDEGGKGVVAAPMGDLTMPLIAADKRRLDQLKPLAEMLAKRIGKPVRLARFSKREDMEIVQP